MTQALEPSGATSGRRRYLLLLVLAALGAYQLVARASVVAQIQATVEEGYRLQEEACVKGNLSRIEEFSQRLALYYSATQPSGPELATRQADFARQVATPLPAEATERASHVATALAKGVMTGSLESWLEPVPTLYRQPEYSQADETRAWIRQCHELAELGAETNPMDIALLANSGAEFVSVTVNGDSAEADVWMPGCRRPESEDPNCADRSRFRYVFEIVRTADGWRIADRRVHPSMHP